MSEGDVLAQFFWLKYRKGLEELGRKSSIAKFFSVISIYGHFFPRKLFDGSSKLFFAIVWKQRRICTLHCRFRALQKLTNKTVCHADKILACTDVLLLQIEFRVKMQQQKFDKFSSRKQKTQDMLFSSLGWNCLLSRYVSQSEHEETSRAVKLLRAKNKLLRNGISGDVYTPELRKGGRNLLFWPHQFHWRRQFGLSQRETLFYVPTKCLCVSLQSLWGNYRNMILSLKRSSSLLKKSFLQSLA